MVPALGAGSSISTLSVEISTTVSPSATESPTFTAHSRIVPSVTDSPPAGVTMSMISPPISAVPLPLLSAAAGAGASPDSISHSSWPTSIVSPSPAWIFTTVPAVGDGTSASTLSVEISTRTSSRSTGSPSFLCHSRTVPSVTDSPMAGMATCTVVFTAIESLTLAREPQHGWSSDCRGADRAPGGVEAHRRRRSGHAVGGRDRESGVEHDRRPQAHRAVLLLRARRHENQARHVGLPRAEVVEHRAAEAAARIPEQ